eukprot:g6562.t1
MSTVTRSLRGLPMVPCSSKPTVTIDAGERFCLKLWRCYKTERRGAAGSKGKFFLSEYLTILVNALGEDRWAWRTLTDTNSTGYECSAHPFNVCALSFSFRNEDDLSDMRRRNRRGFPQGIDNMHSF